jgi:invasion protein IalB
VAGLVNQKKAIVFQWLISVDPEKKGNKMTISTLTGILVGNGIAVRFGDSEPVRVPYKICMPQFCAAEIPFSDSWLKTFKASKGFTATITAANGKEIKYDVSLSKFSEAFDFYTTEVAKTN